MADLRSSFVFRARGQPDLAGDDSARSRDDRSIRLDSDPDFKRQRDVPFIAQPELKNLNEGATSPRFGSDRQQTGARWRR